MKVQPTYEEWLATEFLPIMGGEFQADEAPASEGQGDDSEQVSETEDKGLYDLSSVPEDQRQYVEPILKDIEGNVTKKLQSHAEYRKQWEPYEELKVNEIEPNLMQELVSIAGIADDEQALQEWWKGLGSERGWYQEPNFEEDDDIDWEDDDDDLTDEDLQMFKQAIDEAIDQKTAPLMERAQEQEQEILNKRANETIDAELAKLKDEHGDFNEKAVCRLALTYEGPEAIQQGFKDYQELINGAQNGVFEGAAQKPASPEGPGRNVSTPEKITSFKEAGSAARERLKADTQA